MPQITTIIPTYRRPQLLPRAIQSVFNQSFGNFEIQVYDNASGDETPEVVRAIASRDRRVKYFRHERNIGLIENFAFGMSRVSTPYFNLLSDDDIVLPGFFEAAIKELASRPQATMFIGGLIEADPSGRILRLPFEAWQPGFLDPSDSLLALEAGGLGTWTGMLFRRELLTTVGNLNIKFEYAADIEFELRVLTRYPVVLDRTPSAVFFINPFSASVNQRLPEHAAALLAMLVELRSGAPAVPALAWQRLDAWLCEVIFGKARFAASSGKIDEALSAAETLREGFGASGLAALVSLLADQSVRGTLARAAFRSTRQALRIWRHAAGTVRFRHMNALLALYLEQLRSQVGQLACPRSAISANDSQLPC